MKKVFTTLFLLLGLLACATADEGVHDYMINICRPSAFVRGGESPDFYIDDKLVGELKNGSKVTASLKVGQSYKLMTTVNPLMMRFKDDVPISGTVRVSGQGYFMVKGRLKISQVLAGVFAGAIGEAVRQNTEIDIDSNWEVDVVDEKIFNERCDVK